MRTYLLIAISALLIGCDMASAEDPYEIGDVDMNGLVNKHDAEMILDYVARVCDLTDLQLELADVDGDGEVDVWDASLILQNL